MQDGGTGGHLPPGRCAPHEGPARAAGADSGKKKKMSGRGIA